MGLFNKLSLSLKATLELGTRPLILYGWYQLGLHSGFLKILTPSKPAKPTPSYPFHPVLTLPKQADLAAILGEDGLRKPLTEADEIVSGHARLFGGKPIPVNLTSTPASAHWTEYTKGRRKEELAGDIKFTWEPGRFGWAYTLGRAYHLCADEQYPEAFWSYTDLFLEANPPNQGLQWVSAQEVALRLLAFAFALHVFAPSPHSTAERVARLAGAIAEHAARIPPTLSYARSLNNNHLLSEAVGLYTAGLVLPAHPSANKWRSMGWRWLNQAFQTQIADDGTYVQHSANYHRLILQEALWVHSINQQASRIEALKGKIEPFQDLTIEKISAATRWLLALVDFKSGSTPNLGPNDGANVLPLSTCAFADYRPVLQAASQAFLGERSFPRGEWDEWAAWLQIGPSSQGKEEMKAGKRYGEDLPKQPSVLRNPRNSSWAYLRAASFKSRPAHADQLHLDLWWRGLNIALDPGTYLYNGQPPWDNPLTRTAVHNTISLNGADQMTFAGRFLWLDWAQAEITDHQNSPRGEWGRLIARHDGYRRFGVSHQRRVEYELHTWRVIDEVLPLSRQRHSIQTPLALRLHWLLRDWAWELQEPGSQPPWRLVITSPYGRINLRLLAETPFIQASLQVVRAGELVHGEGPISPTWGWYSPTYGEKVPALSFSLNLQSLPPIRLSTEWELPEEA